MYRRAVNLYATQTLRSYIGSRLFSNTFASCLLPTGVRHEATGYYVCFLSIDSFLRRRKLVLFTSCDTRTAVALKRHACMRLPRAKLSSDMLVCVCHVQRLQPFGVVIADPMCAYFTLHTRSMNWSPICTHRSSVHWLLRVPYVPTFIC